MKKRKKLWIRLGAAAAVVVLAAGAYLKFFSAVRYDYSHLLPAAKQEKATAFRPLGTESRAGGMQIAAKNGEFELLVNPATAEIAVLDGRSGAVWYSNPPDRKSDGTANELAADSLSSQMDIAYFDENRKQQFFYSFGDSVERGQFQVQSLKDGLKVTYTLGDLSLGADALPRSISEQRLNEKVLDRLSDTAQKKAVKRAYVKDSNKKGNMVFLESTANSEIILGRVLKAFEQAGYTKEDLAYDNSQAGITVIKEKKTAVIPLEYRLKDDGLSVTVPAGGIQEKGGIKLQYIEPLKFFGAGSLRDTGYLMVPSGSGGIINFNNGKQRFEAYRQNLYGDDLVESNGVRLQVTEPARLPVFGLRNGDNAFLARIESGDSAAAVLADVSGRLTSYNTVYPRFTLRSFDQMAMSGATGSASRMTIVENEMLKSDLTVTYRFLPKDRADYSGMARCYRELLTSEGKLKPLGESEAVPFYLDVLGAAEKQKFLAGFPYQGTVTMTTYRQAEEMLGVLSKNGVKNVRMRYLGWFNRGVNHDIPTAVHLIGSLGSRADLARLDRTVSQGGGRLYPDAAFQKTAQRSKRYTELRDSARYLDGWAANAAEYDRAEMVMKSLYPAGIYNLVSPNTLPGIVDRFLPSYGKLGVNGLSLRDLGDLLTSDKRKGYPVNREAAKAIAVEQMGRLGKDHSLMISGGNAYSLGFSQDLVNVPSTGNRFDIIDEIIPFYQMVVHGSADCTGTAANLTEGYDSKAQLLKMLSWGMYPHYLFSYESSSELEHTASESFYSTDYRDWLNDAAAAYRTVNEVCAGVRTAKITRYVMLRKDVYRTEYDNGVSVTVNYGKEPVTVGSVTVGAENFALEGSPK